MAKFLTTSGTSYYLEQLILNAKSELVLVTPYLQLSPNFIERLRDADNKGIQIILVYRTNKLNNNEWHLINELENIDIFSCENLHAKCYQNEDSLIISSMNLYQFSQENNREMSILLKKNSDEKVFQDASREIQSIINVSVIKKSSGKMGGGENRQSREIILDPNYSDKENFHLPHLHNLLEDAYANISFSIEEDSLNATDQIIAKNFPIEGIDLQVDDRIFFLISEQNPSANWYDDSAQFYKNIPEAQIFLDSNKLKFYWRERTKVPISEQTLPIKANAFLEIIDKVVQILKN